MSYLTDKKNVVVDNGGTTSATIRQTEENGPKTQMTRRMFMRTFGAGAAAFTLNACGGGGMSGNGGAGSAAQPTPSAGTNTPPQPTPSAGTNTPPLWSTVPTITFTEGVVATISIAGYVTDTQALTISKNSAALPAGVTYNAATKSFIYDGIGSVGLTDGHVLTAVEV
jgi:hypothetical protein